MSTTDTARHALERRRETPAALTILELIDRQKPAIRSALGDTIGAERFARVVTTEIKRNPRLLECQADTVLGALMLAAQLQLEPGPLGHVYLVPYKDTKAQATVCQFIIGYKGMIDLASRSERVAGIEAEIVYEGDEWTGIRKTQRGPRFEHVACKPADRGARVGIYCAWMERLGPRVLVPRVRWCWPEEIEAAKARSAAGRKNEGPWRTDEEAMWRKTAVRRAAQFLPMTPGFGRGLEVDELAPRWDHGDVHVPEIESEAVEATEGTES